MKTFFSHICHCISIFSMFIVECGVLGVTRITSFSTLVLLIVGAVILSTLMEKLVDIVFEWFSPKTDPFEYVSEEEFNRIKKSTIKIIYFD